MTKNQEIAQNIIAQLGGLSRLNVMLGLKDVLAIENGLSFKIKVRGAKINYVKIVVNSDLYNLEFGKIRGLKYTVIETLEGVYVDKIKGLIAKATGCDLNL